MVDKIENKILCILEYLVAIFIVLECRSVYLYSVDKEFYIMQILGIATFCLFVANILFKKIKIKDIILDYKFILGLTIYNIIYIIALKMKIAEIVRYLYIFEAMFLLLYLYYKENCKNVKILLRKIVNVVIVISLISLFFHIFGTLLNLIPKTGTFKMTWGDFGKREYSIASYFNMHFNIQSLNILGISIPRNTGIFTEGPMFALNIIIALAIQLFILKDKDWFKTFILAITLVTTLSTAGLIGGILCFVCYLLCNKNIQEKIKKSINKKRTIIICILFILIIVLAVVVLLKQKMQTASYSTRVDDYIASILAWGDHVIFGNGIFNEQAIINYMSDSRGVNTGVSNSIATTLAGGGVFILVIYLYAFGAMIENYKKHKDVGILCFFVIMIYLSITTVFQYTIMMINIMALTIAIYHNDIIKKNKNIILIDFPKIKNWEFKENLNKITNLQWEEVEGVSNWIRKNKISNLIRYIKYFLFPLDIFIKRAQYKNIVAWQQFYGLLYAFYCRLFHTKKHNNLVIMTFIYKQKKGLIGKIYFKFIKYVVQSKYVDVFICFSKNECEYYSNEFNVSQDKFKFSTLGIENISLPKELKTNKNEKTIISCGRSNRDYNFLYNALKNTNYNLNIISDECKLENCKNITIYNNVFGRKYLKMLNNSYIAIIPLKDENISAGQLVILQAMQLGKPIICTNSNTVSDYIEDGVTGFIVKKDAESLRALIEKLYNDEELYNKISKNQKEIFEKKFSTKALANQVGSIINEVIQAS